MGFGWIMDPNMSTKGANSSITITSPQHDNVGKELRNHSLHEEG